MVQATTAHADNATRSPGQCEIVSFFAWDDRGYNFVGGNARQVCQCMTHRMSDIQVVDGLCPIGRIEATAEAEIVRLKATLGVAGLALSDYFQRQKRARPVDDELWAAYSHIIRALAPSTDDGRNTPPVA